MSKESIVFMIGIYWEVLLEVSLALEGEGLQEEKKKNCVECEHERVSVKVRTEHSIHWDGIIFLSNVIE